MRKFYLLLSITFISIISRAQVTVTATAGTVGPTAYTTLKGAFDAVNAGTHQGAITISLTANTTETATAALNASGAPAAYTSVNITATTAVTVTGNIIGAIVKLNGADNVTIDGRIGGTGRNITISNSSTSAATAAIWLSSLAAGSGCTNNIIRNLELACGATQNTGTNSTFGIIMNGTTISTTADGNDNDNNTFFDNRIIRCRYGIVTRGVTTNLNQNINISNNLIGPTAFGADQIGKNGIFMQSDNASLVSGNTVQFVGGDFANTTGGADRFGISIGSESWASTPGTLAGTNYTITKNIVHDIIEERTFSSVGINLSTTNGAAATNNIVANNFVYNVKANGTAGDAGIGIGIGAGNGDFVIFNSVRMSGDLDPNASATAASQINACMRVAGTPTNLTIKNNILYNDLSSSSAAALNTACIIIPSAAYAWGTGGLNNNDYYFPASNTVARTGALGTTSLPTTFFATLANWQGALSPTQDGSSKGVNPAFASATDLHIPLATASQLESAGVAAGGITVDIDNDTRPGPAGSVNGGGTAPDMGADEFDGIPVDLSAPGISYTPLTFICATGDRTLSNVTITDGSGVPTSGTLVPRIYYRKNAGTWFSQPGTLSSGTGQNGVWSFTIVAADMGGLVASDVVQYYIIAQDIAASPNIGSNPAGVVAINVNTVTTPPASPNSYTISNTLVGTYNVGAGQTYTTLTAAITAYNNSCISGPVVFELTDATYNEAAAMTININTYANSINTLTIKPASGVNATINVPAASTAAIKILNSYVIIDGSNNGSTTRNLTINNTSVTSPTVIAIASSGTTPNTLTTVKNCIIINGINTSAALVVSDGATLGNAGYFNNITIQNNDFQRAFYGVYANAALSAGNGNNLLVENNIMNTSGANAIRYTGIYVQGADGAIVRGNNIGNFETTTSEADRGVWFATGTTNSIIEKNNIHDLLYTGTSGYGAKGIAVSTGLAAANVTVKNNMISNITGDADSYSTFGGTFAPVGIYIFGAGQGGVGVYFNTIYMYGNTLNFSAASYSIGVAVDDGAIATIKNNIIHNSLGRVGATGVGAVGIAAELTASQVVGANYNDFYHASNAGNLFGKIAGTDYNTLATWQAASGGDANSKNILPVYTGAPDLHLVSASNTLLNNLGTPVAGITNDYDNDVRDASTPDMGADEFAPPPCTAVAGTTVALPAGPLCSPGATTVSLTGTGVGTGTSYQWQTSPDNATWTDSTGQVSATMAISGLTASRYYRCMVTCAATATSNPSTPVQVVITPAPTAGITPGGPLNLCSPITQLLTSVTNAATPSYQWKLGGTNIGGALSATYTATTSGSYTVTITDGATTCSNTSAPVVINIDPAPTTPILSPAATTICRGNGPVPITITSGGQISNTLNFGTQAAQNTASTTALGYPAPYTVYYGGQRMQMLVLASELSAAGFAAGSQLNNIQFPVVSLGANWGTVITECQNFQVSIGNTALTSISTFQTGLTQVIAPGNFTPVVGYTNTHTFGSAFVWNGTSNIIIETTFSNNITGLTADLVTQYNSPTAFQSCIVYRVDGTAAATVATTTTISYSYNARPDFKLNGTKLGNFTWLPVTDLYTDAAATIPYTGQALATVYANPSANATYTAASCGASGTSVITVTPPSNANGLAATAGGAQVCVNQVVAAAGTKYFDGSCNLVAKITPSGAPAVSGNVNTCVTIDGTVQVDADGHPYVQRHYDIEPAVNAANVQGLIRLYFTQAEFDAYNTYVTTNALPFPLLPTGGADNGNVRVTQFHGTGTAPGNYTGGKEFLTPIVTWNATNNWWEVNFPVTGFSGFYVHTGSQFLLPISITALSAKVTGATNTVYWTTATEVNNKKFIVERSTDGRSYLALGEVASVAPGGNSTAALHYRFEDIRPVNGKQQYRLRIVDRAGNENLSQQVTLRRGEGQLEITDIMPNPTTGKIHFNIIGGSNSTVNIIVRNVNGKEVMRKNEVVIAASTGNAIDLGGLANGMYLLEAVDTKNGERAVYKVVKQ
jgi:hypothetical protein